MSADGGEVPQLGASDRVKGAGEYVGNYLPHVDDFVKVNHGADFQVTFRTGESL